MGVQDRTIRTQPISFFKKKIMTITWHHRFWYVQIGRRLRRVWVPSRYFWHHGSQRYVPFVDLRHKVNKLQLLGAVLLLLKTNSLASYLLQTRIAHLAESTRKKLFFFHSGYCTRGKDKKGRRKNLGTQIPCNPDSVSLYTFNISMDGRPVYCCLP